MQLFLYTILTFCCLTTQGQASSLDTIGVHAFKKQIKNSSILGLGEVGHGFESINEAKAALASLLQQELQFKAIAFESSFTESVVSYLSNDSLDIRLKNFLYPFWNTTSVKATLKGFFDNESSSNWPLIVGFDVQEDCRFKKLSHYLIKEGLSTASRDKLNVCDSILSYSLGKNFSRKGAIKSQEYLLLSNNYIAIKEEIKARNLASHQKKLLLRCIDNRQWLCKYLTLTTSKEKMYFRDSLMASNLKWIKEELFPTHNLIVWTANTHVAKLAGSQKPKWMGEWLSSFYPETYFSIAFQKGTGDHSFTWRNHSFTYSNTSDKEFDMVIYLGKLKKIRSQEWMTPCD
jgi:erythromycin esterase